jgi:hypothetical protein
VSVGQALGADSHNVRKAAALMAWSDVLMAKSMGQDACGAPLQDYRQALGGLTNDAEIAYTTDLISRWCGQIEPITVTWTPTPQPAGTRLRLDSDVVLSEVELWCGGRSSSYALTTADRVVPVNMPAGRCEVVLHGAVPMRAQVEIPVTGGELRCVVRGGQASCG